MINLKKIIKVLLLALFICAYSGESLAQSEHLVPITEQNYKEYGYTEALPGTYYNILKNTSEYHPDEAKAAEEATKEVVKQSSQNPTFCGDDFGIFTELVQTGQKIFNRLRDLIYVVAGFGIIAVAVGGFFGNLNWKWLGAIVISLVVVATAGELIVLMTGCEQFGSSLVTNTLTNPTVQVGAEGENPYTQKYNEAYTEDAEGVGKIAWDDYFDESYGYGQSASTTELQNGVAFEEEGTQPDVQ